MHALRIGQGSFGDAVARHPDRAQGRGGKFLVDQVRVVAAGREFAVRAKPGQCEHPARRLLIAERGKTDRDQLGMRRIEQRGTLSLQRRLERNLAGAALDLDAVLDRQIEAERVEIIGLAGALDLIGNDIDRLAIRIDDRRAVDPDDAGIVVALGQGDGGSEVFGIQDRGVVIGRPRRIDGIDRVVLGHHIGDLGRAFAIRECHRRLGRPDQRLRIHLLVQRHGAQRSEAFARHLAVEQVGVQHRFGGVEAGALIVIVEGQHAGLGRREVARKQPEATQRQKTRGQSEMRGSSGHDQTPLFFSRPT